MTNDKLLVLIHGSGAVRAGQWARALCINESLEIGSILPYLRQAKKEGYGVIVCNPNDNKVPDPSVPAPAVPSLSISHPLTHAGDRDWSAR